MTDKQVTNIAASVRQRLLKLAKVRNDDFLRVLTQYALERLLYRLSLSPYADRFTLKGALLFLLWMDEPHRRTKDLDLLGSGDAAPNRITELFRELCAVQTEDDGLIFAPETVNAKLIREENIYGGVRVRMTAFLEKVRISIQVDIGFGDVITPAAREISFPTLLDFPAPILRAYAQETVIAEKLSALVALDLENSRMKDFYDMWVLGREFAYDGASLCNAVAATFERRSINIPEQTPIGLSIVFADDVIKQSQWKAFIRQSGAAGAQNLTLTEVISFLAGFLLPVLRETKYGRGIQGNWPASGPWKIEINEVHTI